MLALLHAVCLKVRDFFFFLKSVEKIQTPLKSDSNNRYFTRWPIYAHLWSYLAEFFLEWKIFQTKVIEKMKTHFVFSKFSRKSCLLWYEYSVENYYTAEQATHDNIAHAHCMMAKATNTHSEYVIFIAFPPQQWSHKRAALLHYTHTACLVYS